MDLWFQDISRPLELKQPDSNTHPEIPTAILGGVGDHLVHFIEFPQRLGDDRAAYVTVFTQKAPSVLVPCRNNGDHVTGKHKESETMNSCSARTLSCDGVGNERSLVQGFIVGTFRLHSNLSDSHVTIMSWCPQRWSDMSEVGRLKLVLPCCKGRHRPVTTQSVSRDWQLWGRSCWTRGDGEFRAARRSSRF